MSFSKNILIFIGPPGAGKGSLAQLCTTINGWEQLSTGNLCRKHIAEETEIGKKIDFAIKSGKLISDDLVTEMVEKWLLNNIDKMSTVILDGYPRTVVQAMGFDNLLKTKFPFVRLRIVRLVASDDIVASRLCSRRVCANKNCQAVYSSIKDSSVMPKEEGKCDYCGEKLIRRSDDEKEAVIRRLSIYHQHEKVLLDFYRNAGHNILELDAEKSLVDIFDELNQRLNVGVV